MDNVRSIARGEGPVLRFWSWAEFCERLQLLRMRYHRGDPPMGDPWTDSPPAAAARIESESGPVGGAVEMEEGLEDGLRQRVLQVLEEARDSANTLSVRARAAPRTRRACSSSPSRSRA